MFVNNWTRRNSSLGSRETLCADLLFGPAISCWRDSLPRSYLSVEGVVGVELHMASQLGSETLTCQGV